MTDQLSRDLASLKIDRAPSERQASRKGRWLLIVALGGSAIAIYPRAKSHVESLVFKREVESAEVVLLSPIQSQVDLTATGYVTPQLTARVGSKTSGRISKVYVHEGDAVQRGQVLFELDPADERSELGSAQARIKAATAKLEASRADLRETESQLAREQKMLDMGALAPATVEDRKLRVEAMRRQVDAAEADVQVSRAEANVKGQQLSNLRILSPISGTAVTKPAQLGDVVEPASTLVELVDFESLLVEVDVPEARLGQVKPDGPCELVLDAAPDEHLKCKVTDFSPRMNRAKATATVKVKLAEKAKRLWPDMAARVSFLANEVEDSVRKQPAKRIVAKAALAIVGDRQGLWTIREKQLRFMPVTTGSMTGSNVELSDGPMPGTHVVLNPTADLREGQRVKDRRAMDD